ncbi:MAG: VWA domain-containing protein [Acidobacteria bacterium]|nr:VWA domain-containing protein [Acidobacteriota bacterium]
MPRFGWAAALATAGAFGVLAAPSDLPPPAPAVETVDVSLVLVPVVVRDAAGRPILDLNRADFTITEEGRPQEIAAFGREARPVSIVLALDTSPSMRQQDLAAKRAAIDFVRGQRLPAAFAVESFDDAARFDLDFTSDRRAVESTIAALRLGGDNTALFDAADAASSRLEPRDGGRVAVVFTDGTETLHPQDESEKRLGAVIDGATRRDVSIYTVAFGPRAAVSILRHMAEETGGEAFSAVHASDLQAAFASVAESVGSRYLLGYTPPAGAEGFRRIGVSVSRPGLKVAARRGYFSR